MSAELGLEGGIGGVSLIKRGKVSGLQLEMVRSKARHLADPVVIVLSCCIKYFKF